MSTLLGNFSFSRIARAFPDFKVVLPVHPHIRKRLEELGLHRRLEKDNVVFTKLVGYLEFDAKRETSPHYRHQTSKGIPHHLLSIVMRL